MAPLAARQATWFDILNDSQEFDYERFGATAAFRLLGWNMNGEAYKVLEKCLCFPEQSGLARYLDRLKDLNEEDVEDLKMLANDCLKVGQ